MSWLTRIVTVEENEVRPILLAVLCYFLLLASYFVIRPIRDEMGVAGGVDNLKWLFLGTLIGMLLIHPVFTALVSRLPRNRFIPLSYSFFAFNIVAFWAVFQSMGDEPGIWAGRVFFVWTSIFNLVVVSIFWSLMADLFRPDQAKRLFGFVAIGGTIGAVTGSSITARLASRISPVNLLLVSAAILALAMVVALVLMRSAPRSSTSSPDATDRQQDQVVGGGIFDGVRTVFSSPYLIGIVGYMLLYTITATLVYCQQAEIVGFSFADRTERVEFFSYVDLAVNSLTAIIQIFLTGRIVRRIGIALALATLPLVCILGFAAIGVAPTLMAIAVFQVLRRTSNYAIARPCREMLYTVLSRDAKYKAKNFIDTFVYRAGDQVGVWSYSGMTALGLGASAISLVALPLATVWFGVGLWLGRRQRMMATTASVQQTSPGQD